MSGTFHQDLENGAVSSQCGHVCDVYQSPLNFLFQVYVARYVSRGIPYIDSNLASTLLYLAVMVGSR